MTITDSNGHKVPPQTTAQHPSIIYDMTELDAKPTRIMICVGYNPVSQRLIQRANHLSRALNGDLLAVHIQTDASDAPGYWTMLEQNMEFARNLGAETLVIRDAPLAEAIARVAHTQDITHIVMGESARSRWAEIQNGSLIRQILRATHGIDIYIVADPT
ncbi:MAG: hypothetical protein GFH27_549415n32 [Chloroflexi bacterium AL-W]|nr:hypothetical protein [Chloroflexi bacterium AL-N1]NOK71480.1 hypothetical protein [Chloroflexi bacterium AL-N10]NOK77261.1 hypothetical protein [Chloroflexi bacterium AL-N5]NOK86301.1 hypothetical protein [Chloroflexi bacterium AL-W]NOK93271.1 hypothetical protein [Chloroflexi bacterium AL-N15]